jgi:integrase
MSIHTLRLANGRPSYRVKLRTSDGRQFSRTFRTRKEAEQFQAKELTAQVNGTAVDPWAGQTTLAEYADTWLRQRVGLRPKTIELYRYLLDRRILPALGPTQLRALTPARIRGWYADMPASASTKAKSYRLLRTVLTTAVEDEIIPKNPCIIKGAGTERHAERPIITAAQVAQLTDAVNRRYRAMILLAAWCGLRYGELAGLTRADVDTAAGSVRVRHQLQELRNGSLDFGLPKTQAGLRTVAMPPHIIEAVAAHLAAHVSPEPDALVFTSATGTPLRKSNFNRRVWQPALTAIELSRFHFHDLRHTGNTLAASTGASTKELMSRMGHASPRAALIYQHASPERDRRLAQALSELSGNTTSDTAPEVASPATNGPGQAQDVP